jgi:hypothetical protein
MWFLPVVLVLIAVVLLLPRIGEQFNIKCDQVGWVDNKPYLCRRTRWHHGPHASAWHTPEAERPGQVRVKWFDGEYGTASSVERRRARP